MTTERAKLTELSESQAGAYTTINEAFRQLEAILVGGVVDKDLSTPPGSPAAGDVYIVGASPTGAWAGNANNLAHYYNGSWHFYSPATDWRVWVADEATEYRYSGSAWVITTSWGGRLVKSISASVALTTDDVLNDIIEFNGTLTAAATVTFPIQQKSYTIVNNTTGGFSITLKVSGGSEIILPATRKTIIYNNGANLIPSADSFPFGIQIGGTIAMPLYSVSSAPAAGAYYGHLIAVTDGDAGALCLAVSDGGTWKRIALGATISAT